MSTSPLPVPSPAPVAWPAPKDVKVLISGDLQEEESGEDEEYIPCKSRENELQRDEVCVENIIKKNVYRLIIYLKRVFLFIAGNPNLTVISLHIFRAYFFYPKI